MLHFVSPAPYWSQTSALLAGLHRHRRLAWELTKRDLVDRYVEQVGGTFWALLQPALMIAVFIVMFGTVFTPRTATGTGVDQMLYLVSGLVPWMAVQDALGRAPSVITGNAPIVKQVAFPLAVLPVKSLLPSLVILPVGHALLLGYVVVQQGVPPAGWLLLPLCWALLAVMVLGLAYAIGAVAVFFRDIGTLLQLALFLGLYVSPVFYRLDAAPGALRLLMLANPFTWLILCFQDATFYGGLAHPWAWVLSGALALLFFMVGARAFNGLQRYFGTWL